jgi:copper(I)-binding protein
MAAACGAASDAGGVRVTEAWTRPASAGETVALYFTMENPGDEPDRLLSVSTSAATTAELHESMMEGDLMHMMPVSAIDVPAGETIELRPGGLHVMLIGLNEALNVGDQVPLSLEFERAGSLEMTAVEREP